MFHTPNYTAMNSLAKRRYTTASVSMRLSSELVCTNIRRISSALNKKQNVADYGNTQTPHTITAMAVGSQGVAPGTLARVRPIGVGAVLRAVTVSQAALVNVCGEWVNLTSVVVECFGCDTCFIQIMRESKSFERL